MDKYKTFNTHTFVVYNVYINSCKLIQLYLVESSKKANAHILLIHT